MIEKYYAALEKILWKGKNRATENRIQRKCNQWKDEGLKKKY